MINKLRKKILLIILLAISIPFMIVLSLYSISYYNNTIRVSTRFVDKFLGRPNDKPDERKENKIDIFETNGVYMISIKDGEIFQVSENVTDDMKNDALKITNKKSEVGIIDNYIYKKRILELDNGDIDIILIESKDEIKKINIVIAISIVIFLLGIIVIYLISKKIAKLIVKPVEDTFNKQRDFISDASHELKTPLAVIRANADVLESDIGKNKWLNYIQNETDNMSKLISELLLLTKIENVEKLREPETFNISEHIELIVSSFESMAFEKKVNIEEKIQKDIITHTFNKDDITHILSTLIDNAIKHTEEKKKVIVELEKNKDKIIINVKNKGEEIPLSERDKIFDRFYRIDKSRNRNEKRYGLGLSIASSIVFKNNGTIHVDYKNGYTVFTVSLPI